MSLGPYEKWYVPACTSMSSDLAECSNPYSPAFDRRENDPTTKICGELKAELCVEHDQRQSDFDSSYSGRTPQLRFLSNLEPCMPRLDCFIDVPVLKTATYNCGTQ